MSGERLHRRLYRLGLGRYQAYLWTGEDGVTLVDAGPAGSGPATEAALRGLGLAPTDLRRLVLTVAAEYGGEVIFGVFHLDRARAAAAFRRLAALDSDVACFGHGEPVLSGAGERLRATAETLAVASRTRPSCRRRSRRPGRR